MKSKLNSSIEQRFIMDLKDLGIDSSCLLVKGVTANYAYDENNQRTDKIEGYTYHVGDPTTISELDIKVSGKKPVITQAELDSSKDNVWANFTNSTMRIYELRFGYISYVINAESVEILKDK